jgi:hypothetical protein
MRENGFQRKERRSRELHTIATDVFCLGESQYFDFDSRERFQGGGGNRKGKSEDGEKLNTEDTEKNWRARRSCDGHCNLDVENSVNPDGSNSLASGAKAPFLLRA